MTSFYSVTMYVQNLTMEKNATIGTLIIIKYQKNTSVTKLPIFTLKTVYTSLTPKSESFGER